VRAFPDLLGPTAHNRLGWRFAGLILLFSSVVTLFSTALELSLDYRRDVGDIDARLAQIRSSYGESLASSLWITSARDLQLQLQGILRLPDLNYVEVVTEQNQLVQKLGTAQRSNVVRLRFPLYFTHRQRVVQIGAVQLEASLDGVYQRLREKVVVILVAQTVKTFLVSLFILALVQWLLGRHLNRIASYAEGLGAGQLGEALTLDRRLHAGGGDELDQMVASLNAMRERLDASFRAVQESESRWKFALEGAGDGVWDFDTVGGAVLFSKRWKSMLGYADEELANHFDTYKALVHPDDLAVALCLLKANFEGREKFFALEQRFRCKDGSWKWVMARGMVVASDSAGRATRMIGTHTDFSERRAAEEAMARLLAEAERTRLALRIANETMESQVRERTAQLEAANKELEAFSYSVSHDLRSPLRGIDGWSLALQEDYGAALDATGQQYLERVRGETQRMGHLIDGMLELSRLGRAALVMSQVDLTALAQKVSARIAEAHPERAFEFVIAPMLRAVGDARLLEALLVNLLENAAKFSATRSVARIEVGLAPAEVAAGEPGESVFMVRDNGSGFDMRYAQKLFGAFQRLHKASEFAGTGIGLATVRRIVERHGGRVWAAAELDHGATFYFTLKEYASCQK
jgi:PAS domain S-box-containing protein